MLGVRYQCSVGCRASYKLPLRYVSSSSSSSSHHHHLSSSGITLYYQQYMAAFQRFQAHLLFAPIVTMPKSSSSSSRPGTPHLRRWGKPGPRIAVACPSAFTPLRPLAPHRLPRARGKSDLDMVLLTKVSGTESVSLPQKSAQCAVKRLHEYIVYQGRLPARQVQWQSGSNWHCWYGGRVPEQLCVHALDHPLHEIDIPSNGAESLTF